MYIILYCSMVCTWSSWFLIIINSEETADGCFGYPTISNPARHPEHLWAMRPCCLTRLSYKVSWHHECQTCVKSGRQLSGKRQSLYHADINTSHMQTTHRTYATYYVHMQYFAIFCNQEAADAAEPKFFPPLPPLWPRLAQMAQGLRAVAISTIINQELQRPKNW